MYSPSRGVPAGSGLSADYRVRGAAVPRPGHVSRRKARHQHQTMVWNKVDATQQLPRLSPAEAAAAKPHARSHAYRAMRGPDAPAGTSSAIARRSGTLWTVWRAVIDGRAETLRVVGMAVVLESRLGARRMVMRDRVDREGPEGSSTASATITSAARPSTQQSRACERPILAAVVCVCLKRVCCCYGSC